MKEKELTEIMKNYCTDQLENAWDDFFEEENDKADDSDFGY